MTRTQVLQEIRRMRFKEAYGGWQERRRPHEEAARLLGVCERVTEVLAVRSPANALLARHPLRAADAGQLGVADGQDLQVIVTHSSRAPARAG